MITIEEAIKHCEEVAEEQVRLYRLCPSEYDCNGLSDCKALADGRNKGCLKRADENRQLAEWLKELKKYREKQIPQKPEYIADGYSNGELVYDMAKCPNCGNDDYEYDYGNWGKPFCPECGQALDWSKEENDKYKAESEVD